jgi:hypothetical protein
MNNNPSNNNPRGNRPKRQPGGGQRPSQNGGPRRPSQNGNNQSPLSVNGATMSRGAAVRAQKRSQADAQKIANQYAAANPVAERRANFIDDSPRLKVIGLGGMDGGGAKNMVLL